MENKTRAGWKKNTSTGGVEVHRTRFEVSCDGKKKERKKTLLPAFLHQDSLKISITVQPLRCCRHFAKGNTQTHFSTSVKTNGSVAFWGPQASSSVKRWSRCIQNCEEIFFSSGNNLKTNTRREIDSLPSAFQSWDSLKSAAETRLWRVSPCNV